MSRDAALWVLEYLIDSDKVDDDFVKPYFDAYADVLGAIPHAIYARLLLRVLRAKARHDSTLEGALEALLQLESTCTAIAEDETEAHYINALRPNKELLTEAGSLTMTYSIRPAVLVTTPPSGTEDAFPAGQNIPVRDGPTGAGA